MEINFTLIVQAVHFLIAYGILRLFAFRPAVHAVLQEQRETDAVLNAIATNKREITTKKEQHVRTWRTFRHDFWQQAPQVYDREGATLQDIPSMPPIAQIAPKEYKKLEHVISTALTQAIERHYE